MKEINLEVEELIKSSIREVPNFPKEGIMFKDITPILENNKVTKAVLKYFIDNLVTKDIDAIIGIESRGFFFGMLIANELEIPFIPVRKKGKLPYKTVSYKYDLEYGSAEIEVHEDVIKPGMNVLIHDDLLATGGTAKAAAELVKMCNANVYGFSFIVDLTFLNGKNILEPYSNNILTLVEY